jgi:hypothetical protein
MAVISAMLAATLPVEKSPNKRTKKKIRVCERDVEPGAAQESRRSARPEIAGKQAGHARGGDAGADGGGDQGAAHGART